MGSTASVDAARANFSALVKVVELVRVAPPKHPPTSWEFSVFLPVS